MSLLFEKYILDLSEKQDESPPVKVNVKLLDGGKKVEKQENKIVPENKIFSKEIKNIFPDAELLKVEEDENI